MIRCALSSLCNTFQIITASSRRTGDFFHDDRRTSSTATWRVIIVIDLSSRIIGDRDSGNGSINAVGCHREIHHVTRVVLHQMDDTCTTISPLRCSGDLDSIGGGEQQPGAGGIKHAFADESRVHRFMAGTTTGDHGDPVSGGVVFGFA